MLLEKSRQIPSEGMKRPSQTGNNIPVEDVSVVKVKSDAVKNKYCMGIQNARSMNQGKLNVVKQEMAKVNTDILGMNELKWTGWEI